MTLLRPSLTAITPATITDKDILNESLEQVAKLRYAISDEEYTLNDQVAVAINDTQGRYIGIIITCSFTTNNRWNNIITKTSILSFREPHFPKNKTDLGLIIVNASIIKKQH